MAILQHPASLDHPLVKELDELSRRQGVNFQRRQRSKHDLGRIAVALEDERAELEKQRVDVEAQIQQLLEYERPVEPQIIQDQISAKHEQVVKLQREIATLRRQLVEVHDSSVAKQQLIDRLAKPIRRRDEKRTTG